LRVYFKYGIFYFDIDGAYEGGCMSLAQRIRQRREQLAMSQSELARRTGVPQSRISEFEHGSKTGMTLDTAKRLARVLGVSIDYLAGTWDEDEAEDHAAAPPAGARG
jgi:transcriptional regulator with XRE-family HTH domain